MDKRSLVSDGLPFMAMVVVEIARIGLSTISKAAMASGLNQYVFILYYDGLGTIIYLPWFICRCLSGKTLPLTFPILCRFFSLSLIGKCLYPSCFYAGLSYASVTLGAAIGNLSPIFTYLLAISLRMEKLNLRKLSDQTKAIGCVVAAVGALIVTLYKGPALLITKHSSNTLPYEQPNWPIGGAYFTLAFLCVAILSIFQADTARLYPDEVSMVFFYNVFGTLQIAVASLFMVKDPNAWKPHQKIEIAAIIYAACSISVFANTVTTWCLRTEGAFYVSMFTPLSIAIAAVMGFVFLADNIYLGSVVGSAAIVVGFYAVMWGKAKTTNGMVKNVVGLEAANQEVTPLLHTSHS